PVTVTLSVGEGTLTVAAGGSGAVVSNSGTSSVTINGTVAQINALLNSDATSTVSYLDSSDAPGPSTTLSLSVNDNGNTGSGGALPSNIATATINIAAVNDAPVAANTHGPYSATEQVALSLKNSGLLISDADAGDGPVTVTLSVGEGTLTVAAGGSGAVVSNSGTSSVTINGTVAQINALLNSDATSTVSYLDSSDAPGPSTTLSLSVNDNGNTGSGGALPSNIATATINIAAVNDAPVAANTHGPYSATEQVALSLKNSGLLISDADAGDGPVTVTLSVGEGTLTVAAGGSGAVVSNSGTSSVTINGTVAQINALLNSDATSTVSYLDSSDAPGPSTTLSLSVNDNGNTGSGGALPSNIATATINIAAVNDAPVAANTHGPYSATEQVALSLKNSGLLISDADAGSGPVTVTLSVGEGTLTVGAGTSGALVSNNGTSSVTINGTVAQINALLNTDAGSTVSYIDSSDAPGTSTTLSLSVNDNGNTGSGGALASNIATATINIGAVNDPPVISGVPASASASENTPVTLVAPSGLVVDVDAIASDVLLATLKVSSGTLTP